MNNQNPTQTQPKDPLTGNMRFSSPKAKEQAVKNQIALLSFVDDLIKARTDQKYAEKDLPNIKTLLLKEVNDAINTHLVSLLTEKDQLELDKFLDQNPTDDQLDDFFRKKIPNLEVEIASVLLNFRAAYLYPLTVQKTEDRERKTEEKAAESPVKRSLPPAPPVAPAPLKNLPS